MPPTSSSSAASAAAATSQPPPNPAPAPNTTLESEIRFSRKFTCSLCTLSFEGSVEQRDHMRGEWHVHNLKLKMQSLPAVSESTFLEERKAESSKGRRKVDDTAGMGRLDKGAMLKFTYRTHAEEVNTTTSSEEEDDDDEEEEESNSSSEEDDEEDEYSVSASGSEEENGGSSEAVRHRDGKETLFLPSGKIVGRKSGERERRTEKRTKAKAKNQSESISAGDFEDVNITTSSTSNPENTATERAGNELVKTVKKKKKESRALAERHAAGLVGLSDKQRSVLAREEKKMMSLEGRERGGFAESVDRKGNSQKHYRIGGSRGGKKMGGLEKRLG